MKVKALKKTGWFLGCAFAIVVYLGFAAGSWLATCGIIKLITLCFGWDFSWSVATGVWLIMFLLRGTLSNIMNTKK